ncbi:MAG: hypothetical protein LIO90_08450 [Bacteroidales bacterium]|nr:hypothetical protein [Bacteroidales bacterium]
MKLKYIPFLFLLLLGAGCTDDDIRLPGTETGASASLAGSSRSSDGLTAEIQSDDQTYYVANCRVPLVGAGRMINRQNNTLLAVVKLDGAENNITDLDLSNTFSLNNVAAANFPYNEIVSIIDVAHTYKGGQRAGFVVKTQSSGVLSADVLSLWSLVTLLDGKQQESVSFSEATSVLDLGVGNISSSSSDAAQSFVVEGLFSQPFNEIKLCMGGVTATVAQKLEIYYAFVGENPMIPAVNDGNEYFNNNCSGNYKSLVDEDLENGPAIAIINLYNRYYVKFGREVPAGTEVGFYITSGSVLELGLGSTIKVTTYADDDRDVQQEYTQITKVLELSLIGEKGATYGFTTSKAARTVMIEFEGVSIDVGVTQIHYAYIREKTTIDPSSFFALTDAVVYNPGYHLLQPTSFDENLVINSYSYKLVSGPGAAEIIQNANGDILWNMNVPGKYVVKCTFSYTYTDSTGEVFTGTAEQYATITRKVYPEYTECNDPLVNTSADDNTYTAYTPEGGFAGIKIGGGSTTGELSYIVDSNTDNYLQINQAVNIQLASNVALIGVKKNEGSINSNNKKVKVGFVVGANKSILDGDVLQFLRIRLTMRDGTVIDKGVVDGAVDVNLINTDNQPRVMLGIETEAEFQCIELYSSGVLNLQIADAFQIYYAFIEDCNTCQNGGSMECMQMISSSNYGAEPSVSAVSGINLFEHFSGLSNLVDGDMNTVASLTEVLTVVEALKITITFDNYIQPYQETGFVIQNEVDLLDVIGTWSVKAYDTNKEGDDKEVTYATDANNKTSLSVAEVKLGNTTNTYLSVIPTQKFNQLVLTAGKGLKVPTHLQVVGAYFRPDYNDDGVMDCITDDPIITVNAMNISSTDICSGDDAPTFTLTGGNAEQEYILDFTPYDGPGLTKFPGSGNSYYVMVSGELTNGQCDLLNTTNNNNAYSTLKEYLAAMPCGVYYITLQTWDTNGNRVDLLNKVVTLTIHPTQTTWLGLTDRDWNVWTNWDNGVPWECTDVVIPRPAQIKNITQGYPELVADGDYRCDDIHFEVGGEMIGSEYLRHGGLVFVDMELKYNEYQLVSAPLQSMVTGDMFIPSATTIPLSGEVTSDALAWNTYLWSSYANYFTLPTKDNYTEQRVAPAIFQRFWAQAVTNEFMNSRATDASIGALLDQTDWSRSFNHVENEYAEAQGFAVKLAASTDGKYNSSKADQTETFRFPKDFDKYNYYSGFNKGQVGTNKNVGSHRSKQGLFWADYNELEGKTQSLFDLRRYTSSGSTFVFGNPFLCHIDIMTFLEENTNVNSLSRYDGAKYVSYQIDEDGRLNVSASSMTLSLNPMEAVLLSVTPNPDDNEEATGKYSYVKVTTNMLSQTFGALQASTQSADDVYISALVPTSSRSDARAECLVTLGGSDSYIDSEDARVILASEDEQPVVVYTVADGRGVSINRVGGEQRIAIGLQMARKADVEMRATAGAKWAGWLILDTLTGERYPLGQTFTLKEVDSSANRFFLVND